MKKIKQTMKYIVPIVMIVSLLFVASSTADISLAEDNDSPFPEKTRSSIDLTEDNDSPFPERNIGPSYLELIGES